MGSDLPICSYELIEGFLNSVRGTLQLELLEGSRDLSDCEEAIRTGLRVQITGV
jgi:hypothetical protein